MTKRPFYEYYRIGARYGDTDEIDDVKIDALTNAVVTIDYAHHEVHAGSSFSAGVADTAMGDTDTIVIAWKTPPGTKRIHILGRFTTLVGGKMELLEGPTWTQGSGTAGNIINHRREASMQSSILLEDRAQATFTASDEVMVGVTGLAGGTPIIAVYAWGSRQIGAGGGRGTDEFILKPDTTYAARFTAIGNSNTGQVMLGWYEHTDKH